MGYWYIDFDGTILGCVEPFDEETERKRKEIGNYFDTEAEAEEALEKLKAWQQLKDKGFEINDWAVADNYEIRLFGHYSRAGIKDYLDLLFGGEE